VKIINKDQLLQHKQMELQLKREIAVMKRLKHRNIVELKEVLQTPNRIYIILEFVTGGELFEKIVSKGKLDEPTARRYFQQLLSGLWYCHQQGVAHRDLKPENILLDGSDTVKISDFGLSNLQKRSSDQSSAMGTLLNTVCGTPNYATPEVLQEKPYSGFHADVWSCGVILFVMLCGHLPFDDDRMHQLYRKIERGEYLIPSHVSPDAADLIRALLQVDPDKRLSIQNVVHHPWFTRNDLVPPLFPLVSGTADSPQISKPPIELPQLLPPEQKVVVSAKDEQEAIIETDEAQDIPPPGEQSAICSMM